MGWPSELAEDLDKRHGFTKFMAACFLALPLLVIVSVLVVYQDPLTLYFRILKTPSIQGTNVTSDEPIDRLVATGFDEESCLSRYQSALYRKTSPHKPSSRLISRLRRYEELHKKCGPHTELYNKTVQQLKSGAAETHTECKYIVWIAFSGLGNRMITMVSAFLYALLTNRVLLVDQGTDIANLFCEPFPDTTWILPRNFPISDQFKGLNRDSPQCHGRMIRKNLTNSTTIPSSLYIHLASDADEHDKRFLCHREEAYLAKVPWLILRTDNYFLPALFLNPSLRQELAQIFPDKETVFHHLGRYLFHPSNQAWGQITRYYESYLSRADESLGIQIRTFDSGHGPLHYIKDQILACTHQQNLLPQVNETSTFTPLPSKNHKLKAILITSLSSGYSDILSNRFRAYPTVTGELVAVYQPSQEEDQRTGDADHDMKALTEMYLLSFSDVLVTSSWSTFGYVAQSLGGLRPWILTKTESQTVPDPPCRRDNSMEPCFHNPPLYDCNGTMRDSGTVLDHVQHCVDRKWGIKLVNSPNDDSNQ